MAHHTSFTPSLFVPTISSDEKPSQPASSSFYNYAPRNGANIRVTETADDYLTTESSDSRGGTNFPPTSFQQGFAPHHRNTTTNSTNSTNLPHHSNGNNGSGGTIISTLLAPPPSATVSHHHHHHHHHHDDAALLAMTAEEREEFAEQMNRWEVGGIQHENGTSNSMRGNRGGVVREEPADSNTFAGGYANKFFRPSQQWDAAQTSRSAVSDSGNNNYYSTSNDYNTNNLSNNQAFRRNSESDAYLYKGGGGGGSTRVFEESSVDPSKQSLRKAPQHDAFYKRTSAWMDRVKASVKAQQTEREQQETFECTFAPIINKSTDGTSVAHDKWPQNKQHISTSISTSTIMNTKGTFSSSDRLSRGAPAPTIAIDTSKEEEAILSEAAEAFRDFVSGGEGSDQSSPDHDPHRHHAHTRRRERQGGGDRDRDGRSLPLAAHHYASQGVNIIGRRGGEAQGSPYHGSQEGASVPLPESSRAAEAASRLYAEHQRRERRRLGRLAHADEEHKRVHTFTPIVNDKKWAQSVSPRYLDFYVEDFRRREGSAHIDTVVETGNDDNEYRRQYTPRDENEDGTATMLGRAASRGRSPASTAFSMPTTSHSHSNDRSPRRTTEGGNRRVIANQALSSVNVSSASRGGSAANSPNRRRVRTDGVSSAPRTRGGSSAHTSSGTHTHRSGSLDVTSLDPQTYTFRPTTNSLQRLRNVYGGSRSSSQIVGGDEADGGRESRSTTYQYSPARHVSGVPLPPPPPSATVQQHYRQEQVNTLVGDDTAACPTLDMEALGNYLSLPAHERLALNARRKLEAHREHEEALNRFYAEQSKPVINPRSASFVASMMSTMRSSSSSGSKVPVYAGNNNAMIDTQDCPPPVESFLTRLEASMAKKKAKQEALQRATASATATLFTPRTNRQLNKSVKSHFEREEEEKRRRMEGETAHGVDKDDEDKPQGRSKKKVTSPVNSLSTSAYGKVLHGKGVALHGVEKSAANRRQDSAPSAGEGTTSLYERSQAAIRRREARLAELREELAAERERKEWASDEEKTIASSVLNSSTDPNPHREHEASQIDHSRRVPKGVPKSRDLTPRRPFSPSITKRTAELASRHKSSGGSSVSGKGRLSDVTDPSADPEEYIEFVRNQERRKAIKLAALREEQRLAEEAELTFRPVVHDVPEKLRSMAAHLKQHHHGAAGEGSISRGSKADRVNSGSTAATNTYGVPVYRAASHVGNGYGAEQEASSSLAAAPMYIRGWEESVSLSSATAGERRSASRSSSSGPLRMRFT